MTAHHMPWLRLWIDMPNDPKWRTIARLSKQPITAVISVYLHLLVSAANATERGRADGVSSEDIASALDLESEQVDAIMRAMQGRVLDGNLLSGWTKRQPIREDGAAERSRAWRESKKQEAERDRTQPNASEPQEERREEEIREERNTGGAARAGFAIPLKSGNEYTPSAEEIDQWVKGYPAVDVLQQLGEMRVWSQANTANRKTAGGIVRFITGWLAREQDKGPRPGAVASITIPAKPGVDPALAKIEADARLAVPMPAEVRARLAALRGQAA